MSDQVRRQAEEVLRSIKREFALSFRGKAREHVPELAVRVLDRPQHISDDSLKEFIISRPVYVAFQDLLHGPNALRVYSFENKNFPWFDLSFEGAEGSLTFRIRVVHPISELKSAV